MLCSFWHPTEDKILGCLADGLPRSAYQIGFRDGIEAQALWSCLGRCWKKGLVLRSEKPIRLYRRYKIQNTL